MELDSRLYDITRSPPSPLVFATVSGAHLYGFASADSDWDLRGVHVLPIEQVAGLDRGAQTIEVSRSPESDGFELDLVTHDVEKFMRLMLRPNGYVLEQLYSLVVGLPLGFSTGVEYASIYSPTFGELIDEEFVIKADWDDSAVLERLPIALSPGVLFAFETSGSSDGARKGNYFEFHAAPTYTLSLSDDYPLDLSVPVRVGINMNRYYEDDLGNDDIFGFVDVALAASAPMAFVPERFGSWSLSASVHYIRLGKSAARIGETVLNVTNGDRDHFYFMIGPMLEF